MTNNINACFGYQVLGKMKIQNINTKTHKNPGDKIDILQIFLKEDNENKICMICKKTEETLFSLLGSSTCRTGAGMQ